MPTLTVARPALAALQLSPRRVTAGVFFAFALGIGLWAGAIPVMMRRTGIEAEGLGLALALHSGAYVAAMLGAGWLASRTEPRRLLLALLVAHAGAFVLLFSATTPAGLTFALIVLGLSAGATDLVMNAEAAALEREAARPVLTRMHAAASGAFALGAIGGSLLATGAGPLACAALACAVIGPVAWGLSNLPPRLAPAGDRNPATAQPASTAAVGSVVRLFGIVLGISVAAEITAQMWSAQFLARQAGGTVALAGVGAAFFAGCQALVRLAGDALRHRFDDRRIIETSLVLAALGFAAVAASDGLALAALGFALVGLGTGCLVPCCFALVAHAAPHRAAAALGQANLVAGLLRLPTPLCLGIVAARWGDAAAFGGVAAALALGFALMLAFGRRRPA